MSGVALTIRSPSSSRISRKRRVGGGMLRAEVERPGGLLLVGPGIELRLVE